VRGYGGNYDAFRALRDAEAAAAEAELAEAQAARKRATADARRIQERQAHRAARGKKSRREGGVPKILLNARRNASEGTAARLARTLDSVQEAATRRVDEAKERVEELALLRMDVAPSGLPKGKDVLVLEDVAYTPPGAGAPLLEGIDLVMRGPERVALAGPNGSGKTTLLQLAIGELMPARGTVRLGVPRHSIAYLDQAVRLLPPLGTVLEAFMAAHPEWDEGHARHVLARYLFPGDAALAPVDRLSGGERMRAGLAYVLGGSSGPSLLLLDEPTNHLDFQSLEVVERAVAAYDGALLVVSHDPEFLAAVGVQRELDLGPRPSGR
jgi:ATPase subunit of ABC transporter with duplicated ATPase domains